MELFVATLQAFIFTLLTTVYIGMMTAHDDHHDEHAAEHAH
jgi:F0F1-type ATP synthase membrane subunit a